MILEEGILELIQKDLFKIRVSFHERTWEYYQEQYHTAFNILIEISKEERYLTNCKFRPFMFLMRHSLELYLKGNIPNLYDRGILICHNLNVLFNTLQVNNSVLLKSFSSLQCDSEGDCWRYLTDKNGKEYFSPDYNMIDAFEACQNYYTLLYQDNSLDSLRNNKAFRWELTFHPIESRKQGLIGSQYDSAIIDILRAIEVNKVSINEVYLPLLFLLRHSLEIKLKAKIMEHNKLIPLMYQSLQTHSPRSLYNTLSTLIENAIQSINDRTDKDRCMVQLKETTDYIDTITQLDTNSLSFRFPKDKRGNNSNYIPKPNDVKTILQLWQKSDSLLSIGISFLIENSRGYIDPDECDLEDDHSSSY